MTLSISQAPRQIAIVGCGPKGLYALDSLCEAARKTPSHSYDVHIFEESPHPGAGPIYDPGQPNVLLMNFRASKIDAWTGGRGPDLLQWLMGKGSKVAADEYVPRAVVGRYLTWCFNQVVAGAPPNIHIAMHEGRVCDVRQLQAGWMLSPGRIVVDELLICTGHQDWCRTRRTECCQSIPSPFPVDQALTRARVPPGASVACKGFALTFLDTMLALTEGRGGSFTRSEKGYIYRRSGDEPRLIAPFSRTGRPMRAKVDTDRFVPPQGMAFWEARLDEFDALLTEKHGATFVGDIWPLMLQMAERTLDSVPGTAAAVFADWQGSVFDRERCRYELRAGCEIAIGTRPPDILWALGETWRRCYPRLVRWISHQELPETDAARFRAVAAEMERLAFGPPAQNTGKLICLERTGLVSLDHLKGDLSADVTVDTTIPPAGSAALSQPLNGLLRDGHLSVGALGGITVNDRAQALVNDAVTPGLSIIGRATEGSVLGNDTLSRTLHDLPERWAANVVRADRASPETSLEQTA
ncbi:FAD/NAD(P)-binding protein [Leisingera caerulea]|uniref:FAD/NAD(P)-binding protein n=1 Tax=Leisingera caerulea TaxID=506591 RepID=A0A9Q9LXM7_LEICA|nr:FAD/NAD(P)-binding domain-containing protein [Leisingera caerulea]UWQ53211.1 FAD/NAD(P)-binding protein [Leisingera caerulea]